MRAVLGILVVIFLAGCASYADLGDGRYAKTALSEERSPFGTNGGFVQLQDCKGEKAHWYSFRIYSDCQPITAWVPVSSQGQGGQVAAGLLNVVGAGVIASQIGQGASATANAVSQSVAVAPRGRHH
jgi:hypothetical protein